MAGNGRGDYGRGGYGHAGGRGYGGGMNAYRNQPGFIAAAASTQRRPGGGYNHGNQGGLRPRRGVRCASGQGGKGASGRLPAGTSGITAGRGFMGSGNHPSSPGQYLQPRPSPAPLGRPQPYRGCPQFCPRPGVRRRIATVLPSAAGSTYGHSPFGSDGPRRLRRRPELPYSFPDLPHSFAQLHGFAGPPAAPMLAATASLGIPAAAAWFRRLRRRS
jgi:hypothetical protein